MTTTTDFPPPPVPPASPPPGGTPPPGAAPHRVLRRSRSNRVGAGVAGGLGEYFGLDPVLFRVLFGTAAFFGGAGILAYLLAWAAIPDEGTERAAIDGWIRELRRRRIPFLLVMVVAALVFWAVAFSWWAPGPFFPVVAVVVLLIVAISRTGRRKAEPAAAPVDLSKEPVAGESSSPTWLRETREWITEARAAARVRRRRALPVRIAVWLGVGGAVAGLAIADAVSGIRLPVYFWVVGAIVLVGLGVGIALRRTPWSVAALLIPVVIGTIAFGNTGASLHDGVGQHEYTPTSEAALATDYRLALGQTVLDLRHVGTLTTARTVHVTSAAGQVRILLAHRTNATVDANVRIGDIEVDGQTVTSSRGHGFGFHHRDGYDINHIVLPPAHATGAPLTVVVHLADGQIDVRRS